MIQQWKIVYQHLNGFVEKQMRKKCAIKNVTNI